MRRPYTFLLLTCLLVACSALTIPTVQPTENPAQLQAAQMTPPAAQSAGGSLSLEALQNATYRSPDWGEFQLTGGFYHRPPAAPGESPDIYVTQMIEPVTFGDLNGDGLQDAAVILATQNGGTGHFIELAAMIDRDGQPYNAATISLGDRVAVEQAHIQAGVIVLDMRVHGPNDGLCCPSQFETRRFQLQGDQLVRLP